MALGKSIAKYSCTALMGVNKAGDLKPDEDGYYELLVGGLNVNNFSGDFYTAVGVKELFDDSSDLMRRVREGNCNGEVDHPSPTPGMSRVDFVKRVLHIDKKNVCCHFKEFELVETDKVVEGAKVILIKAKMKPSGVHGDALRASLENKHENVCFSIRSLTRDTKRVDGTLSRTITTVIGFDWVNEPGIATSNKFKTVGLESLSSNVSQEALGDVEITPEHLDMIDTTNSLQGVSMESTTVSTDTVRKDLGWDSSKGNVIDKTPSLRW